MRHFTCIFAIASLMAITAAPSAGQSFKINPDDDWCSTDRDGDWDSDYHRHCEVREATLDAGGEVIRVDAEPNGGISIKGWDQRNILIRAKVVANARSTSAAEELAREVRISTAGTIEAEGPHPGKHQWYSVSFEIFAPRKSNVDLQTKNGGITISALDGRVRFQTLNGGVELTALSGDVMGKTTNGGVSIELHGDTWDGSGLDVETVNGGVSIVVPKDYSAELETGTVNGHIEVDFPVLVQGRFDRRLNATLGDGGKPIRAVTTNGGVVVTHG